MVDGYVKLPAYKRKKEKQWGWLQGLRVSNLHHGPRIVTRTRPDSHSCQSVIFLPLLLALILASSSSFFPFLPLFFFFSFVFAFCLLLCKVKGIRATIGYLCARWDIFPERIRKSGRTCSHSVPDERLLRTRRPIINTRLKIDTRVPGFVLPEIICTH